MANKMLIDATHEEETRVVVLRGERVEEFDLESASRRQLRGNIYLAKVTRVEPSLQAAFIDYGGNRHGFLAFSEIHPDYYQIPLADRQALLEEAAEAVAEEPEDPAPDAAEDADDDSAEAAESEASGDADDSDDGDEDGDDAGDDTEKPRGRRARASGDGLGRVRRSGRRGRGRGRGKDDDNNEATGDAGGDDDDVEMVGAEDALEEVPDRRPIRRRSYKIQEVIKRRQILLVQVVKEERGTKGAALTTYLSLAGRYCVLMPNTARGGGISRKITNHSDRKRLKSIAGELEVPEGMGVIVRTAGANRTKAEIRRDYDYLIRLWENIRELTLKSTAPSLIYEEGSLIKRSIRDLYNKDISEIVVEGEESYKEAKAFMRMLMPSHAKNVRQYKDARPIFTRFRVEAQLDKMFSPEVTLPSGGYLVMNQTEALVAVDVNSGRSTREHNIEDTALKTNLEAAEEVARQLRLRDLAGLIVIDFIDMDEKRNNRSVERKVKECLKTDRARIQVGRISHFGLLEMSRQRIRSSVIEGTMDICPHCDGTGRVRSVASTTLQVMRAIEESAQGGGGRNLDVRTSPEIALYMLNQKRAGLRQIEERFGIEVIISVDNESLGSRFVIERGTVNEMAASRSAVVQIDSAFSTDDDPADAEDATPDEETAEATNDRGGRNAERSGESENGDGTRRKRRRRRRGRRRTGDEAQAASDENAENESSGQETSPAEGQPSEDEAVADSDSSAGDGDEATPKSSGRRRSRRGGRGRSRDSQPRNEPDEAAASDDNGQIADTAAAINGEAQVAEIADADVTENANVAPETDDAPPPKPRRRRSRAKPREEDAVAAEAEAPDASESAQPASDTPDDDTATRKSNGRRKTASPLPSGIAALKDDETPEPAAAASEEKELVGDAEPSPRRRGWWQRRLLGE